MSVYYVRSPDLGLVKIGFAGDPAGRLCKMQVDSPTRLVLAAVEDGGRLIEAQRHQEFAYFRARGEWFHDEGLLAEHIDALPPYAAPRRKALPGALGAWLSMNDHSLATFAVLIGATESTLSRICAGKQFPRRAMMLKIFGATSGAVDANALLDLPPHASIRVAA